MAPPDWWAAGLGLVVPHIADHTALVLAVGIVGATVMPHAIYLHSGLTQDRAPARTMRERRTLVRYSNREVVAALTLAGIVNVAMVMMAARAFHVGHSNVAEIGDAYKLLSPMLGAAGASTMFAIALLASGQNSSLTGTLAGQVVMEGFIHFHMAPWLRRLLTRSLAIIPTVIVTIVYGERGTANLLILSQVILSMQLSFAVFPLVAFTSDRQRMGAFVNRPWLKYLSYATACLIAILNALLLVQIFRGN